MINFPFKLINCHRLQLFRRAFSSLNRPSIMNSFNIPTKELRIKTDYGHLAVKVWNESGKKTPILALHGWMDNAGTWDNLCPLLDEQHPVYAIDFPGHGYSSHQPLGLGTYYTDNLVSIDKIIHHFKWNQIILLGHSMGGGASLLYAGTMPHLVEKIIVIDILRSTTVDAEDQPRHTATSFNELLYAEGKLKTEPPRYTYDEIIQKLIRSYDGLTEDAAKALLVRNSVRHVDGKYSFTYSPVLKVKSTLSLTFDVQRAFYSRIKCDMLLIKSSSSRVFGRKEQAKEALNTYKQTNKNFEFEVIEGTHHVHLINPQPVADIINRFLHGLPQSETSKAKSNDYILSHL